MSLFPGKELGRVYSHPSADSDYGVDGRQLFKSIEDSLSTITQLQLTDAAWLDCDELKPLESILAAFRERGDRNVVRPCPGATDGFDAARDRDRVHIRRPHDERVGFRVGRYDRARPLVIDPQFAFMTYAGGDGADVVNAAAVKGSDLYAGGPTSSSGFYGGSAGSNRNWIADLASDGNTPPWPPRRRMGSGLDPGI